MNRLSVLAALTLISLSACTNKPGNVQVINSETLKDKIAGGWADVYLDGKLMRTIHYLKVSILIEQKLKIDS